MSAHTYDGPGAIPWHDILAAYTTAAPVPANLADAPPPAPPRPQTRGAAAHAPDAPPSTPPPAPSSSNATAAAAGGGRTLRSARTDGPKSGRNGTAAPQLPPPALATHSPPPAAANSPKVPVDPHKAPYGGMALSSPAQHRALSLRLRVASSSAQAIPPTAPLFLAAVKMEEDVTPDTQEAFIAAPAASASARAGVKRCRTEEDTVFLGQIAAGLVAVNADVNDAMECAEEEDLEVASSRLRAAADDLEAGAEEAMASAMQQLNRAAEGRRQAAKCRFQAAELDKKRRQAAKKRKLALETAVSGLQDVGVGLQAAMDAEDSLKTTEN